MAQPTTPQPSAPSVIPSEQVREQAILPWGIAIRITLRGLKIRLGRSLITMSGVVLGIAFLMSVLTAEGLKSGLADENRTNTEVQRLFKLVEGELGSIPNHKISILVSQQVAGRHRLRLLDRLARQADDGAICFFWTQPDTLAPAADTQRGQTPVLPGKKVRFVSDMQELCRDAHVLLMFDEEMPPLDTATLAGHLKLMAQPVILDCHHGRFDARSLQTIDPRIQYGSLSYQMSPEESIRAEKLEARNRARRIWITVISMLVTVIGIANAMLMSVTERIREIGTMKCLGALSGFVVKLFLIESFLLGVLGAVFGTLIGFLVPFVAYILSTGVQLVMDSAPFGHIAIAGVESAIAGTVLAIIAAIYPATVAAKMVPADALRTNV